MIQSLIREKRGVPGESDKVEPQEFVVHSTSWRYMNPNKVLLAYVAYSDELDFNVTRHAISRPFTGG